MAQAIDFIITMVVAYVMFLAIIYSSIIAFQLFKAAKSSMIIEARNKAFKEAAEIAKDSGDFELYDTEGRAGQRLERASIAHDIELKIRSLASQKC